ncbi:MAG TPA: CBS domain-containing protein [Candidatus Acidoferrales bacterium]|nr:CBS domain-containing protein [Candidatus Acidoferrales bacterium]
MKVRDVMSGTPASCDLGTNLGAAVEILWNRNCGILPVLNNQQVVVGVVTDRDLCIALGTRNRLPGEIYVGEIASRKVFSCKADDDVRFALATMAQAKVRRLPVVSAEGKLEGLLSMDDVALHSRPVGLARVGDLSNDDVVEAFKKIYQPALPELVRRKESAA